MTIYKFRLWDKINKVMIYPTLGDIDSYKLTFIGDDWAIEFNNHEDDIKYFDNETFDIMFFSQYSHL